jgi:hypothetical protein
MGAIHTIPEGIRRKSLYAAGIKKQVYVNRAAIAQNLRKKTGFPTCVIKMNGEERQFHAVLFHDSTSLEYNSWSIAPAPVFLTTEGEVTGIVFTDQPETFVPERTFSRIVSLLLYPFSLLGYLPIVSCFVGQK